MLTIDKFFFKVLSLLTLIFKLPSLWSEIPILIKCSFVRNFPIYKKQKNPTYRIIEEKQQNRLSTVTVVFPTRNGLTNGVLMLISSLRKQSVPIHKIIAIDSGSTDGSQDMLKSMGVEVINFCADEFSHAKARNSICDLIETDYILFTVDDAVFENCRWIEHAIYALHSSGAVAASSLQKNDLEDTFSLSKTHSHNQFLIKKFSKNPVVELKETYLKVLRFFNVKFVFSPIDNTNNIVRTDIFNKFKFLSKTVEDLEFGSRLLFGGHKLLLLSELHVSHAHSFKESSLSKYIKRIYLDLKVYKETFDYGPYNNIDDYALNSLIRKLINGRYFSLAESNLSSYFLQLHSIEQIPHGFIACLRSEMKANFLYMAFVCECIKFKLNCKFNSKYDENIFNAFYCATQLVKVVVFSKKRSSLLPIEVIDMNNW